MKSIRAYNNILYTVLLRKIGFHALDSKRYILRDGIHTVAFGNYNIERISREEVDMGNLIECKPITIEEIVF
jgi:hypothetical protein